MDAIVVTGAGAVSAAGLGRAALWERAASGSDALRPSSRLSDPILVGSVPGWEHVTLVESGGAAAHDLCVAFATEAAREALASARLAPSRHVALVFGSNLYDRPDRLDVLASRVADAIGAAGPRVTVSTACASSTSAMALAGDLLRCPTIDAVLAGGADVLTPLVVAGFRVLGLLAPERCAPFSLPVGMSLGEGAGFVVLERATAAARRGAAAMAVLVGAGLAGDAFHPTSPDPNGEAIFRSAAAALRRAGIEPAEVAYVNAHGTGTEVGDVAECRGLVRVFGESTPPISASKSIFGHAQGAAGALEAIVMLEGRLRGLAPPTLHHAGARPGCALDVIAEGRPRPLAGEAMLSVNAGFGGAGAAVLFAPSARAPRSARRAVWLRTASEVMSEETCHKDQQRKDPLLDALLAAATQALASAALPARAGAGAGRGLFTVLAEVSRNIVTATEAAIARRGLARVPATLFARALLISPGGACSAALDLRGPLCAFVGAAGSAAVALGLAGEQIAGDAEVECMLVTGSVEPADAGAAACAVVLADSPDPTCAIELAGWACADAGDAALSAALAAAGLVAAEVSREVTGACTAMLAGVAELVALLRAGPTRSAVLTAIEPGRCCCVLVLVRRTIGDV